MAGSDGEVALSAAPELVVDEAYSRPLGNTEKNWVNAVKGGTGISVLAFRFRHQLSVEDVENALFTLVQTHPRLRCGLVVENGKWSFTTYKLPEGKDAELKCMLEVETVERPLGRLQSSSQREEEERRGVGESDAQDAEDAVWIEIVEEELNRPFDFPGTESGTLFPLLTARFFTCPAPDRPSDAAPCALILRVHTVVCDWSSVRTLAKHLLSSLDSLPARSDSQVQSSQAATSSTGGGQTGGGGGTQRRGGEGAAEAGGAEGKVNGGAGVGALPSLEDAVPKGQADKPFWQRGFDALGYAGNSMRHALLPLGELSEPRRSRLLLLELSPEETRLLLTRCQEDRVPLSAAITAAAFKAAAACKDLEGRTENFGVTTLVDCRALLSPPLPASCVGFYYSAFINTHGVSEESALWELARRVEASVAGGMKSRKHFCDMGDLNFLMAQAMEHPNFTPSGSLRQSVISIARENDVEDLVLEEGAGVLDNLVLCSSVHGVGPCVGAFSIRRAGCLHMVLPYPHPLFSEDLVVDFRNRMHDFLRDAVGLALPVEDEEAGDVGDVVEPQS